MVQRLSERLFCSGSRDSSFTDVEGARLIICDSEYTFSGNLGFSPHRMPAYKETREAIPAIRSVGFLLAPGFALLSYASAVEPLRPENRLAGKALYCWWHAAPGDRPALASSGAAIMPGFNIDSHGGSAAAVPDFLLVCAGGNPATFSDRRIFNWLRRIARRGVLMGG